MKRNTGRDAQFVGKNGKLVCLPVAVGVFADSNSISTFAFRLQLVRIVIGLRDPQSPAFVPCHRDWFSAKIRFRGEKFDMKSFRHDKMLYRFFGRKRHLHFCKRLVLSSPTSVGTVIGNLCTNVDIFKRFDIGPRFRHFGDRKRSVA